MQFNSTTANNRRRIFGTPYSGIRIENIQRTMRDVLSHMRISGIREIVMYADRLEVTLQNDDRETWTPIEFGNWCMTMAKK